MNTLLGLWWVIAPFVFGINGVLLWNDVIVGALVVFFAGYNWGIGNSGLTSRAAGA